MCGARWKMVLRGALMGKIVAGHARQQAAGGTAR